MFYLCDCSLLARQEKEEGDRARMKAMQKQLDDYAQENEQMRMQMRNRDIAACVQQLLGGL